MVSPLFFYQLVLVALVWLCVMLQMAWPSDPAAAGPPPELPPLLPKRKREPTPCAGFTTKPPCDTCASTSDLRPQAPYPPATAHRAHTRTPPPGGHLHPFLPESRLCLSGLGGLGQSPCQWPSQ